MMYVVTQYCSEFDGANHFICTLDGGQIDLESARAAFAAYLKPLVDEFCAKMSEMRALYKAVLDRYSEERSRAAIAHGELTGLPFTRRRLRCVVARAPVSGDHAAA